MSWLTQKKKEFAEKDKQEKLRLDKLKAESDARWQAAANETKKIKEQILDELEGKRTKDGKTLRLVVDEKNGKVVTVFADEEKFLEVWCHYVEDEKYDGDGCSWGTGVYYLQRYMWLHRKYDKVGYACSLGGCQTTLNEDDLAEYLIRFLK